MITKFIYVITALFFFINCTSTKFDYEIHGILSSIDFDGELIYLVPLENPLPDTVDSSKMVIGTFLFKGIGEAMKIIRIRPAL